MRHGGATRADTTREDALVSALWRGVDVYRPLAWVYAVYLAWQSHAAMHRAWLSVIVLAVLGLWTALVPLVRQRTPALLYVETVLACSGILATPFAVSRDDVGGGTLPALWAAACVMGWAVVAGLRGGLMSALVIGVADVVEIGRPTEGTVYNIVTLVLLGSCLGLCIDVARRGQRALTEALRIQAETAERERLSRTIHDGVLQALAFIHRRGEQLGGEAAHLGELAAAQERELRALALGPARRAGSEPVDVRAALSRLSGPRVTVSCPAGAMTMPGDRASEVVAAVEAALANVALHAGPEARAWVLVEDLGTTVVATIRDDGAGYPAGRLDEAAAEGRLGVASSIDGRVRDLGGTVAHRSVPGQGTTVELTVPKQAPSAPEGQTR